MQNFPSGALLKSRAPFFVQAQASFGDGKIPKARTEQTFPNQQGTNKKSVIYMLIQKHYKTLPGDYCEGATPDHIPNSEVKSFSADGTLS